MAEQTTAASSSRRCPCGLCFDPPPFPTRPDWSVRHALCSLILSLRDAKAIALGDVLIAIAVHKVNLCALNMAQRRDITLMLRNTKIILVTTAAIFRCRTVVPDYSNDQVIEYGQKVLLKTQDDADFRYVDSRGDQHRIFSRLDSLTCLADVSWETTSKCGKSYMMLSQRDQESLKSSRFSHRS